MIVVVNLARNIGDSGLILHLFHGPDAIDPDGFELAEVAGTYGRFEAEVTATVDPESTYRTIVTNSGGQPIYEGWYRPGVDEAVDQPDRPVDILSSDIARTLAAQLSALSVRRLTERQPLVTDVMLVRGTTWRIPITVDGLPEDWTRIEFTARKGSESQSASLLHLVLSRPAGTDDGLRILQGAPATDPAAGEIVIVDDQALATVNAAAVATVDDGEYCWDAKVFAAGSNVDQVNRGTLFVERDITRTAE